MPSPSYTYTLTNGTTADASKVSQNFTDILNGVTDGTKDLSINALTCAGNLTVNGNTTLGNASSDTVTVTASLASDIVPSSDGTRYLGSATYGFAGLFLGDASGDTGKIVPATLGADRVWTIPETSADASFVMTQAAQTIAGAKTFSSAIIVGGNSTGDSNFGTIGSVSFGHYYEGTFTGTLTGCTTSPTATVRYIRVGKVVTLFIPDLRATSNSTSQPTVTGMPSNLYPAIQQWGAGIWIRDNSATSVGGWSITTAGVILGYLGNPSTSFTSSGNKGFDNGTTITYNLLS